MSSAIVPGGVLAVGSKAGLLHLRSFGRLSFDAASPRVEVDTVYDIASITKAVATTMVVMALVDEGKLDIEAPVSKWFHEYGNPPKNRARVRDLLSHSTGLPAWEPFYKAASGKEGVLQSAERAELVDEPGKRSRYSDLGFMLLGAIIERVRGLPLDVAAHRYVFEPIGMKDTGYQPDASALSRAAPTGESLWRRRFLRGEVHDENAYRMGGVAGHAGLFSTAPDLAQLAEMLLNGGTFRGRRVARSETVALFTRRVDVTESSRTLGWETPPGDRWAGRWWSDAAFGHTGNTGAVIWIDPKEDVYVILLTNQILVGGESDVFGRVRRETCEAVLRAVADCEVRR